MNGTTSSPHFRLWVASGLTAFVWVVIALGVLGAVNGLPADVLRKEFMELVSGGYIAGVAATGVIFYFVRP